MKTHCFIALLLLAMAGMAGAQDEVPADGGAAVVEAPPEGGAPTTDSPPAEDQPPETEENGPAIPAAYDVSRYDSIWDKNPFTRKVAVIAQAKIDWSQDWALAGMFSHKGKIRVSIRNKQTNEFKHVTNEFKEGDEFELVKANFNRSRKEASAVIKKGGEEATLKYDENAAPVTINNTARPAGGAAPGQPGAPGMAPGVNGRPGQPAITKPVSPTAGGRVFNAPNLPGGVVQQQGMAPGMIGNPAAGVQSSNGQVVQPGVMNPNAGGTNVPTISRRRQLIPAPVVSPQSNP